MIRKIGLGFCAIALLLTCGCASTEGIPAVSPTSNAPASKSVPTSSAAPQTTKESKAGTSMTKNPIVTIEMEDGGKIVLELYPNKAPETVANFVDLVKKGFYNGLTFHRVISGFMIQGGDPQGTGTGGSDKTVKGEFAKNGFAQNDLKHVRGTISMARLPNNPNSATSQFFIVHKNAPNLDGDYAAFGMVTSGIEEVDQIAAVPKDSSDKPLTPVVMKKVTVEE